MFRSSDISYQSWLVVFFTLVKNFVLLISATIPVDGQRLSHHKKFV
jgi:hypothetical protein